MSSPRNKVADVRGIICSTHKQKGTTISVAIWGSEIFYCGDGMTVGDNDIIISGNEEKQFYMNGLVITCSGTSTMLLPWIEHAAAFLDDYEDEHDGYEMDRLVSLGNSLEEFRLDWMEDNPGITFEAELMIFGNMDDENTLLHLLNSGTQIFTKNNESCSTVGGGGDMEHLHGPGGYQADAHLKKFLIGTLTSNDYFRILTEGITIAGLHYGLCGGYVQTCTFGKNDEGVFECLVNETRHTMKNLALHYTRIEEEGHLDNCLIFITTGLPYTHANEEAFEGSILNVAGDARRIVRTTILGVNLIKWAIIRLTRFIDKASADMVYNRFPVSSKKDWDESFERSSDILYKEEKVNLKDLQGKKVKNEARVIVCLPSLKSIIHSFLNYGGFEF